MTLRPRTLFAKTLVTIGVVSAGVLLFTLSIIGYFMLKPLGERATEDFAALMITSAERWAAGSEEERYRFGQSLQDRYRLTLREPQGGLEPADEVLPYFYFLKQALSRQIDSPIDLRRSYHDEELWLWTEVPDGQGGTVQVGFPHSRIGVQIPVAVALVLLVGSLVTLATSVILVSRLTAPMERLAQAARHIGRGQWPEPLPEKGPEELALLTRRFNDMVVQVRELLTNRTTLLAGISHDLRTPLARIQLALAMLPDQADDKLVSGIARDVEQMNGLIGQFLEVARGLQEKNRAELDIGALLRDLIDSAQRGGADVRWTGCTPCPRLVHATALRRILGNLLQNAVRYGGGDPVVVDCRCEQARTVIEILDRGPGIPQEQVELVFQPFYRIEHSRSSQTGGSGLGLAIARQLARANGWRIELLARRSGGLCARLEIPVSGNHPGQ